MKKSTVNSNRFPGGSTEFNVSGGNPQPSGSAGQGTPGNLTFKSFPKELFQGGKGSGMLKYPYSLTMADMAYWGYNHMTETDEIGMAFFRTEKSLAKKFKWSESSGNANKHIQHLVDNG